MYTKNILYINIKLKNKSCIAVLCLSISHISQLSNEQLLPSGRTGANDTSQTDDCHI